MRKLPLVLVTLAVSLVFYAEESRSDATENSDEKLELQVLTSLLGSERKARNAHRTVERYREWRKSVDEKIANGMSEKNALQRAGYKRLLAMSNLAKTMPTKKKRVFWDIAQKRLDLKQYASFSGNLVELESQKRYMEELVVIGDIFDQISMSPADFSVDDIKLMRGQRSHANQLYREGEFDDAYPLLLNLAKRGFKDSQSRLAYILFNGTDTVKKSNLRALGWLGSAAYGDSEPKFRVLFHKVLKQVPQNVRPTVNRIVNDYQQSFAHDEYQNCSTEHYHAYGRVKRTYCRFKLESIAEACELGTGSRCWAHAVNVQNEKI